MSNDPLRPGTFSALPLSSFLQERFCKTNTGDEERAPPTSRAVAASARLVRGSRLWFSEVKSLKVCRAIAFAERRDCVSPDIGRITGKPEIRAS